MQKTCRLCRTIFEISSDDLALLGKLSPEVGGKRLDLPPPTLCPECRQQRRMSFRNERHLYRRKCDVTGKDIISIFPSDSPYTVCDKEHWYSEKFDPLVYGRDYDFSKSFFEQFKALTLKVPLSSLRVELSENCDFNNDMRECKDCYLCSRTHGSQNLLYCYRGNKSSDCVDCTQVTECTHLYGCVECVKCQDSKYLFFSNGCATSAFLLDCRNCLDCFMCCNLRNKQFCFLNEQLTKEEYEAKLKEFDFGSRRMVELAKTMYADIRKKALRPNLHIINCENVSGDNLVQSKNCQDCFSAQKCVDSNHLWDVKLHRDCMDEYSGGRDSELMYETTSGSGSWGCQCCLRVSDSQHVAYSFFTTNCKHIFGSVGLRRSSFCILNKQYSEDDYNALVPKIVDHMRANGEWGEFFPAELSPSAYNDTSAQEAFPLDQSAAKKLGYTWAKNEKLASKDQLYKAPDRIGQVADDVVSHILRCQTCSKNYKIVAQELAFYRAHDIPLPTTCVDCRYAERFAAKNPWRLRETTCAMCKTSMKTSFSVDAPETVVCEACYLRQVY